MKKDDELWLKKMKEMLGDYSEPSPVGGWERLEKEIIPPLNRRVLIYRIWSSVAAVVLLAVAGISIYLLNSPITDDIRNVAVNNINTAPDEAPFIPEPESVSTRIEPLKEVPMKTYIARVNKSVDEENRINEVAEIIPTSDTDNTEIDILPDETKETDTHSDPVTKETSETRIARPSGKDKLHLPVQQNKKRSSDGKWAMSLSLNSGAGSSLSDDYQGSTRYESLSMNQFATIGQAASADFLDIDNKELVFNNGMPYVNQSESLDYEHKQPITVGLSVRKKLSEKFSVETGINYTYLLSNVYNRAENRSKVGEQKLHYIGIPLRFNWNFLDKDKFTLYLTAGGMLEKCVHGKTLTESNTVKQLQASVLGGVGAQFNITKKIGIYAEPGVAYFFKDGSDNETIRKENPFNINLQAGIRLTY